MKCIFSACFGSTYTEANIQHESVRRTFSTMWETGKGWTTGPEGECLHWPNSVFLVLSGGIVCRGSLLPKEGTMASMLLTHRLVCSLQHNYRLLVPGKPWGSWQEVVPAEATIQTRDGSILGDKGTSQSVLLGQSSTPPLPFLSPSLPWGTVLHWAGR